MYQKNISALILFVFLSEKIFASDRLLFPAEPVGFAEISIAQNYNVTGSLDFKTQHLLQVCGLKWLGSLAFAYADLGEFEQISGAGAAYSNGTTLRGNGVDISGHLEWIYSAGQTGIFWGLNRESVGNWQQFSVLFGALWKYKWKNWSVNTALGMRENKIILQTGIASEWHGKGWHLQVPLDYVWEDNTVRIGLEVLSYKRDFKMGIFYSVGFARIQPFEIEVTRRMNQLGVWFRFEPCEWAKNGFSAGLRWYWEAQANTLDFYE